MLHLTPILHSLMRRKLGAFFMVIQLAITATIFSNLGYMIDLGQTSVNRPTGFNEDQLFSITLRPLQATNYSKTQFDLEALKQIEGVENAAFVRWIPLGFYTNRISLRTDSKKDAASFPASQANVSPAALKTLGVKLITGRDFTEQDMVLNPSTNASHTAIISKVLAEKLFGKNVPAVGKYLYDGDKQIEIIGVSEDSLGFTRPFSTQEDTIFYPVFDEADTEFRYLVRVKEKQTIAKVIEESHRVIDEHFQRQLVSYVEKIVDVKSAQDKSQSVMNNLLIVIIITLGLVIAFAIAGQTLFVVNQQTKQLGIRRALGATKQDILLHIVCENAIIAFMGLGLGVALAVPLNQIIVQATQAAAMSPIFIIVTCLSLLTISLTSAIIPAWKASQVSPSIATRNV